MASLTLEPRRIVSVAVIVAVGVNSDGRREVLRMEIGTSEAEPIWVEFLRKPTRQALAAGQPRMWLDAHRCVFLDETGTTAKMTRLRGRCPKGQRLRSNAPFGLWKPQTFMAGLRCFVLTAALRR